MSKGNREKEGEIMKGNSSELASQGNKWNYYLAGKQTSMRLAEVPTVRRVKERDRRIERGVRGDCG